MLATPRPCPTSARRVPKAKSAATVAPAPSVLRAPKAKPAHPVSPGPKEKPANPVPMASAGATGAAAIGIIGDPSPRAMQHQQRARLR